MQKPGNPLTDRRCLIVLLLVPFVILLDIFTKEWIRSFPVFSVIGRVGFIRIVNTHNTGAAFGMFQGQVTILRIVAVVGVVVIVSVGFWLYRRYPAAVNVWNLIAYSFILGGTTGNLIDRIRFGQVTDWIDPGFWPAFNVADSGISVGAVMVAISLLRVVIKDGK